MTDDLLKACPFCGGEPNSPHKEGGSDERNGYNFRIVISCSGCGAAISRESRKGHGGWCNDTGQAANEVVAAWNRRDQPRPEDTQ